jgi:hypothetical protein
LRKAALEAFEGQYTTKQLDEKSGSGNDSRKGIKANFRYKTISCIKPQRFFELGSRFKNGMGKKKAPSHKTTGLFYFNSPKKIRQFLLTTNHEKSPE